MEILAEYFYYSSHSYEKYEIPFANLSEEEQDEFYQQAKDIISTYFLTKAQNLYEDDTKSKWESALDHVKDVYIRKAIRISTGK